MRVDSQGRSGIVTLTALGAPSDSLVKGFSSTTWSATAGRMSARDRVATKPAQSAIEATAAKRQLVACHLA